MCCFEACENEFVCLLVSKAESDASLSIAVLDVGASGGMIRSGSFPANQRKMVVESLCQHGQARCQVSSDAGSGVKV